VASTELRAVRHRMMRRTNMVTNTAETRIGESDVGWLVGFLGNR